MTRQKSDQRIGRVRTALLLLILLTSIMVAAASAAPVQEGAETQPDSLDPIVLSREVSADGQSVHMVVEFPVVADTFVTSGLPDTNWGSNSNLRLGFNLTNNFQAQRMLMRYDFSSIPSQAVINSATFRIFQHTVSPSNDAPMGFQARFLNSAWNENQVTWNSHSPDWGSVFITSSILSELGWREADARDLVREWVNGGRPNFGFIVIGDETPQQRERVFHARDANNGLFSRIVVDFTVSTDTTPPTSFMVPLPVFSRDSFLVQWDGQDNPGGSGLDFFDVQFQVNGGGWQNWRMGTRDRSATFFGAVNGSTYGFRVRAVDLAGNQQTWPAVAQTATTVDTIAPTASVNALPPFTFSQFFTVSWTGSDNQGGSGLNRYDLQYQLDGGQWSDWLVGTTQTSVQVTGAQNGVTYGFRVRAIDNAGNVQAWSDAAQASTTASTLPPVSTVNPILPGYTDQDTFVVSWVGTASPGTTLQFFDIRYRVDNGPWLDWLTGTTNISAVFTAPAGQDGKYQFEVRASDSIGRLEAFAGVAEAAIIVRRSAPFIEPVTWMPLIGGAQ